MFQESCRFRDNALQVINSLGKCIAGFTDAEQFAQAWEQLVAYHCPYIHNKLISKQKHFQVRCSVLCLPLSLHPQQAHLQTETLPGTLHCALPTTVRTSTTSSSPNRNTSRYVAVCFAYHCPYIHNKLISKQKHFQVCCIVLCLPLSLHPQQAHLRTETLPGMLHCVFISLEVQCYAMIIACVANSEAVMPPQ